MAVENDPRPVLRKELARIFTNQRVIRAFEKLFDLVPPEFINQQNQIDDLAAELSQLQSFNDLQNQLAEMQKQINDIQKTSPLATQVDELPKQLNDLQQGPVI